MFRGFVFPYSGFAQSIELMKPTRPMHGLVAWMQVCRYRAAAFSGEVPPA
jgi:hypothetical protein